MPESEPMNLHLDTFTASAFAPFGATIERPAERGETVLHDLLAPSRADAGLYAKLDTHAQGSLPFTAPRMERHEHSEQVFLPLGEARYVIAAALPGANGEPDLATLRGFLVEGTTGICYRRGIWHLPITILDRPSTFLMMMRAVGDAAIDTSWATLPQPLEVTGG
jgi:ureidoglycolate lyase